MIELKDVSFTYESGETENNLSHINLAIQDGETILLCGESGCGKTTLTRLTNRSILMTPLDANRLRPLRKIARSLVSNILIWAPKITELYTWLGPRRPCRYLA